MKKIKYLVLCVTLLFVLVGCIEIIDNEVKSPEITLTNVGELNQLYEETEELDDITFTLVLRYFEDNELSMDDLTITWYEGSAVVATNTLTHFVEIKHTLNLNVRVTVKFTLKGVAKTLTEEAVITVTERPTQVSISNNIDNSTHQINAVIGEDSGIVTYTAILRNNLSHTTASWIIVKRDEFMREIDSMEFIVNLVEDMIVENNEGKIELEIDFNEYGVGNYLIYLQVGKYQSNFQHYIFTYDKLVLSLDGVAVQSTEITARELSVNTLSETIGTGVYKWFVNGTEIEIIENEQIFVHEDETIGGFLYHVEFHPDNTSLPVQISDPVLIVNVLPVGTVEELKNALDEEVGAVILTADITLTNTIEIDYPFTLIGNGHTILSEGIERLIDVRETENVYFMDLVLRNSNRYHLRYHLSTNGYVENLTFIKPGMTGGFTDLSAAIYVHSSEITVKNITILEASNTGIRIDSPMTDSTIMPSSLRILGTIETDEMILLPIASGNSLRENVSVSAVGYVAFVLPLGMLGGGESAIIRWSDESEAISWALNNPNKTEYIVGEEIDVAGITIDVKLPGMDFNGDLSFVYLFLDMFGQHGTMEILNLDLEQQGIYYIIGHNNNGDYDDLEYEFGEDKLLYASDSAGTVYVRPVLDLEPGEYLIKITIGGEMDLGNFKIDINAE
ncbi:MAG: hypothetical protein WC964_04090 [Acholeplasmataceae bacterium]